jgi:large subunit ribosomal protein L18
MPNTTESRLRRARRTRAKIAELKVVRLAVHRSNCHIYAQLIDGAEGKILTSASTLEPEMRKQLSNGGTISAAAMIGRRVAEKAKSLGIDTVAFDRSGFKYHGRVKALAEAARENGLKF